MKKSLSKVFLGLISICIILASLVLCILDWAIPLNIWVHPILTLLFCLFVGFGAVCITVGITKKSSWYFFLSTILFSLAIFYVLFQYVVWWLCIIVELVFAICMSIASVIVCGNKTEQVDNEELKQKNVLDSQKSEQKEELPQIKSFK